MDETSLCTYKPPYIAIACKLHVTYAVEWHETLGSKDDGRARFRIAPPKRGGHLPVHQGGETATLVDKPLSMDIARLKSLLTTLVRIKQSPVSHKISTKHTHAARQRYVDVDPTRQETALLILCTKKRNMRRTTEATWY